MTYKEWQEDFETKRYMILINLQDKTDEEVYRYFMYDNMRQNHPEHCGLYVQGIKCHQVDDLNCFNCGCPDFEILEPPVALTNGCTVYSVCKSASRFADNFQGDDSTEIHCDCSKCVLPHKKPKTLRNIKEVRDTYGIRETKNIQDGYSFLFYLRSWQFTDILDKLKLF